MKKKLLLIFGSLLLLILAILIAVPFFLESRIGSIIKQNVNKNINGTFDFAEARLSLISSFPNAELSIRDLYLINKTPFEGDTLLRSGSLSITMGIGELFKGAGEPIGIKSLAIDKAMLNILVDADENANYDLALDSGGSPAGEDSDSGFSLDMQSYSITNSEIRYHDGASGIALLLEAIQHQGSGDLSLSASELQTSTEAMVSLEMDSTRYLNRNKVNLDALIGIDLNNNKYSFLKNEAVVNQLPLVFDGYVQLFDTYQEVDIQFKTPSSDFKNFLAVIPETYSKNIADVQTTGNFVVEGEFTGKVDDEHIPMFNIKLNSSDASFKYPELPKTVRNIQIDALVENTTGIAEETVVDLRRVSFSIDEDHFNLSANIRDLMGNTKVAAKADGVIHLQNLSSAYPVSPGLNLKGLLKADLQTAFDMESIERKQYEKTRTNGYFTLSNFEYASEELANPVKISSMTVAMDPKTVTLKEMQGVTGKTDFNAKGTIRNLLGFLFNNEEVEGDFNLKSDTFVLNDFMVESGDEAASDAPDESGEAIKIPSFLDCTIEAAANTVHYDNLSLRNVSGTLRIKDQTATLTNMTSSIFNGKLSLNGKVSTKEAQPDFDMQLGMSGFRISETFQALDLFKALAPIATALEGTLNSQIDISGILNNDFTPNLSTITGKALAEILGTELRPEKANILNALGNNLNFIKAGDFDIKGLKTALNFENGRVQVKPFTINYKDIAINVGGGHGFDRSLNYTATLQVPAHYLGKEVNDLIARIDEKELKDLAVPVTATIGGNYSDPQVKTDLTSGVKALTNQLVEIQKQKLINQGKGKANELIGGLLSQGATKQDTVKTGSSGQDAVKEAVGGLLGGTTTKTGTRQADSTVIAKDPVQETAKNVLGGLLGKKKKETPAVKKDTLN